MKAKETDLVSRSKAEIAAIIGETLGETPRVSAVCRLYEIS